MLAKKSLFKVFVITVCFMETQVHSAAMAVSAVESDFTRHRISRGELLRVIDHDRCLVGLDRSSSLVKAYEILKAKIERRLPLSEMLSFVEREKLASDTLGLTKMVAWLKVSYRHRSSTYDYCIKLIRETEWLVKGKRDSALLNANLARILYFKLNFERGDVNYSDFDADHTKRREIYNLYNKAIENGAAKIVLLKAAELIMKHGYSPTGDKARDKVIAEGMLTDFFNPKSVRGNGLVGGMLFSPAQKSGGGISRDRRHSLPFAGSSSVRGEALRLLSLLSSTNEEERADQGISAAFNPVMLPPLVLHSGDSHSSSSSVPIPIEIESGSLSLHVQVVEQDLPLAVPQDINGGSVLPFSGSGGGSITVASPVPLFLPLLQGAGMEIEEGGSVAVLTNVPVFIPVPVPVLPFSSGTHLVGDSSVADASAIIVVEEEDRDLLPSPAKRKKRSIIIDSESDDDAVTNAQNDDVIQGSGSNDEDSDSDAKPTKHNGKKAKKLSERKILKLARRLGAGSRPGRRFSLS